VVTPWAFGHILASIAGHIRSAGGQGLHSTVRPVFRSHLSMLAVAVKLGEVSLTQMMEQGKIQSTGTGKIYLADLLRHGILVKKGKRFVVSEIGKKEL
jgi:hypothetical protein